MKPKLSKFRYSAAKPIVNWGGSFDSLTELKYAISLIDEYDFMRSPVSIYYNPGNLQPMLNIRKCDSRYTPDFLIRHRKTGEAFLIEIKPRAFQYEKRLERLKTVACNFIRANNYDWKFKVVYDDEIILTDAQRKDYQLCINILSESGSAQMVCQTAKRATPDKLISKLPNHIQVEYLMFGRVITIHDWKK